MSFFRFRFGVREVDLGLLMLGLSVQQYVCSDGKTVSDSRGQTIIDSATSYELAL